MGLVKKEIGNLTVPSPEGECRDSLTNLIDLDPQRRRESAKSLVSCPDASEPLVQRLGLELDPGVREALATTLVLRADGVAASGLAALVRSEEASLRNLAVESLKQLGDVAAPYLAELLEDEDSDVRILAAGALETLRPPLVEEWLILLLDADPHVNVCGTVIDLLAVLDTEACLPALRRAARRWSSEPYIGFACSVAESRIEGGRP